MDIKECYRKLDGDFEDTLERLCNESLIERFAVRFLDDPSFQMIEEGVAEGNRDLVFRGSHTLKGVCSNLGFTKLYELSSELTEILRNSTELKGYEEVYAAVERQYQKTVDAIREWNA